MQQARVKGLIVRVDEVKKQLCWKLSYECWFEQETSMDTSTRFFLCIMSREKYSWKC